VVTVHVTADSPLPPEKVLQAARDFSDRRAQLWPMVQSKYLEVHGSGDAFVDVTRGRLW
jgi:hypothetical protein